MSRASTRISIRWLPDPAEEKTDTLVLSVGGYYVDLRVRKDDGSISWLLAGERIVDVDDPTKISFSHIIDSNHNPNDSHAPPPDTGKFSKLPIGDDLEEGEMPNSDAGGKVMKYEEVWRELDWRNHQAGKSHNWIVDVTWPHDDSRAFLAKLGKYFLAARQRVLPSGPASSDALRMELDPDCGSWKSIYVIGDTDELYGVFNDLRNMEDTFKAGKAMTFGNLKGVVRAASLE